MSADLHAAALAAIAARRALIAAAVPPWRSVPQRTGPVIYSGRTFVAAVERRTDDALIVAAVNAFARDTGALEAVLERHREFRIYDECDHQHSDDDPEAVSVYEVGLSCEDAYLYSLCRGCCCEDVFQTEQCVDHHTQPCWPCPDARAALTALGVEG